MHGVPYAEISAGVTVNAVANNYFATNIYVKKWKKVTHKPAEIRKRLDGRC
jgi:hypothetical protein